MKKKSTLRLNFSLSTVAGCPRLLFDDVLFHEATVRCGRLDWVMMVMVVVMVVMMMTMMKNQTQQKTLTTNPLPYLFQSP